MEKGIRRRVSRQVTLLIIAAAIMIWLLILTGKIRGESHIPTTHTIFITGMEVKGATTADKLQPPPVNPKDISKGYGFKGPGEADMADPKKWEVSSYIFSPSFVIARQGDTVKLTTFMVNGDEHEVWIAAPDGQRVVAATKWNRGREYTVRFVADKTGTYQLVCSEHAPSMIATFLVLPRR